MPNSPASMSLVQYNPRPWMCDRKTPTHCLDVSFNVRYRIAIGRLLLLPRLQIVRQLLFRFNVTSYSIETHLGISRSESLGTTTGAGCFLWRDASQLNISYSDRPAYGSHLAAPNELSCNSSYGSPPPP